MGKESGDTKRNDDKLSSRLGWFWVFSIMLPLMLLGYALREAGGIPSDVHDWGIFGDFVGGISNPIISAFSFLALILTIMQSQKVLRINEDELKATRAEIELTREANELQAVEFRTQNEHMQNRAELDAIIQAMLQLSEKIRHEWEFDPAPAEHRRMGFASESLSSIMTRPCYELLEETRSENQRSEHCLQRIAEFTPMVISYIELLLELDSKDSRGPMVKTSVCLMSDIISRCIHHGYLDYDVSKQDKHRVMALMELHFSNRLQDELTNAVLLGHIEEHSAQPLQGTSAP